MATKKQGDNRITFYHTPDGDMNIEVLYANENIWLSQKKIAQLFDTTTQNITIHIKKIYQENELEEKSTCKNYLQVRKEGNRKVKRNITMYSLEAIIAVGYRINSERGTQFRQWAIKVLQQYIHKGFATVQNKLHFAITGNTAAEIINKRVSNQKLHMGL